MAVKQRPWSLKMGGENAFLKVARVLQGRSTGSETATGTSVVTKQGMSFMVLLGR